ncbi:GDP-mannose mannosyl hydrolase [Halomicrobium salinisoli]|uniref:GDP-mannose mannosyl hydrolase n=1 Tax=Halomicrobium salinisoli TaxID=2878391 RepID=UPI001CF0CA26|nr:NUDIX domain-containing protein [Halomicrobium salinisoli]
MASEESHQIPDEEWNSIVRNVPIVSVDLIVRLEDGVVLGKRQNEPAKGEWFVPGGTVFKNECLREAAHRVAKEELGTDIAIDRKLGTYQHFYDTADVETSDGKHYLATAFVVRPESGQLQSDEQHAELQVFDPPFPELHPYVDRYLDAAGVLKRDPAPVEDAYR